MKTIAWARLAKRQTDDGEFVVDKMFPVEGDKGFIDGQEVELEAHRIAVILETQRMGWTVNKTTRLNSARQIIDKVDGGWIPLELLHFE